MSLVETWVVDRQAAAKILGLSDDQLANWLNRYDLFPGTKRGKGYSIALVLRDLLKLGAMRELVKGGWEPKLAANALAPHTLYGALLHEPSWNGRRAGSFVLTLDQDGHWKPIDDPRKVVRTEIQTWPLLDEIIPRLIREILANPRRYSLKELKQETARFQQSLTKLRKRRGV